MTTVRLAHRGHTTVVTFNYNPSIIATIKLVVPSFARTWDPARREWLVLEPVYAAELARVLRAAEHTVIGLDQPISTPDPAAWARAVFNRVGPTRATLAFRLLSRVCHPDHGGDHQIQLELNQAYAELHDIRKEAS